MTRTNRLTIFALLAGVGWYLRYPRPPAITAPPPEENLHAAEPVVREDRTRVTEKTPAPMAGISPPAAAPGSRKLAEPEIARLPPPAVSIDARGILRDEKGDVALMGQEAAGQACKQRGM